MALRLTDHPFLAINFWTQPLLAMKDEETCPASHIFALE